MIERRKSPKEPEGRPDPGVELPNDYVAMVSDVFTKQFDQALENLKQVLGAVHSFQTSGRIYKDEILITVALMPEGRMAPICVHGSSDFDPTASSPTAEDLLGAAVDAVGGIFSTLLDPKKVKHLQAIGDQSLSSFEDIPFLWTSVKSNKREVFVRADRTHPDLEKMADEFLAENDPEELADQQELEKEAEDLLKKRGQN